jgi:hypothetical protein
MLVANILLRSPGFDPRIFGGQNGTAKGFSPSTLLFPCQYHSNNALQPFFFLNGEGPRSRCYGRTTALRLFVQPYDDEDEQFFLTSFTINGEPVE